MFFRGVLFSFLFLQLYSVNAKEPSSEATDRTTVDRRIVEQRLTENILRWAKINSGSKNLQGLDKFAKVLTTEFKNLKFKTLWNLNTRSFIAERRVKNPKLRVLLVAHLDTVFEASHPFKSVQISKDSSGNAIISGPGVADDKGGIALIFEVIRSLQKSNAYAQIDWRIFIAADEEITSIYSKDSLVEKAKDRDIALVFEPGWWDEALKRPRIPSAVGGNAHIEWSVTGIESHSGIAFERGRSAIAALAKHIEAFESWSNPKENFLVNVASITGGGKLNVRPGQASMKVSVRYAKAEDETRLMKWVQEAQQKFQTDGIQIQYRIEYRWHPQILASPALIEELQATARKLNQPVPEPSLSMARSASAILSEAGIPALDAMGPFGSGFHSDREKVEIGSAYERLQLVCQFLLERVGGSRATIER